MGKYPHPYPPTSQADMDAMEAEARANPLPKNERPAPPDNPKKWQRFVGRYDEHGNAISWDDIVGDKNDPPPKKAGKGKSQ